MKRVSVLKLGGELIEDDQRLKAMGRAIASAAKKGHPIVVVHGGGREIDAALAQVGIPKRQVDGLRVTDPETLNIVVSVLAGTINTKFVAAINAAGGKAVGLTGADAGVAPVEKAAPHKATSGETIDLGMVGMPIKSASPRVIEALVQGRLCTCGRVRERRQERKVIQRQRRYVGGQSCGAAAGQAPGDCGCDGGCARQEATRRSPSSIRSALKSW